MEPNSYNFAQLFWNLFIKLRIIQKLSAYDEYNEPESNDVYDIDIENAENTAVQGTATKLVAAQKKGQSEYVGFIEPKVSNQMKHKEILKKRLDDHQMVQETNFKPMLHLGNFLTLGMPLFPIFISSPKIQFSY